MNSKRRIEKLEKNITINALSGAQFVGRYYDELTDEEKVAYKEYKESLGGVADDIACAELAAECFDEADAYHFILTPRHKPLTQEELKERVLEVEEIVQEYIEEYNEPKAKAERRKAQEAHTERPDVLKIEETNILYLSKKPTEQTNDGIIRKEL